jgi:hypothetical protein
MMMSRMRNCMTLHRQLLVHYKGVHYLPLIHGPIQFSDRVKISRNNTPNALFINKAARYHTCAHLLNGQQNDQKSREIKTETTLATDTSEKTKEDNKLTIEKITKRSQIAKNLLNPPTMSERISDWRGKAVTFISKIPGWIYRGAVWIGKYTLVFLHNPMIVKEWWGKAKEKNKT